MTRLFFSATCLLDALRSMLEDELEKKEESKIVTLKEYLDGLEEVRFEQTIFILKTRLIAVRIPEFS